MKNTTDLFLKITAVAFVSILFFPIFSFAKDDISVEGIVYEDTNPLESFVIIDGNFYQKGKAYQTYEIAEIRKDMVVLKSQDGALSEYRINGNPSAKNAVHAQAVLKGSTEEKQNGWDKIAKMLGIEKEKFNPLQLFSFAKEVAILNDLRRLYSQVNTYALDSGEKAESLDGLIKKGAVDPAYKENKNDCTFRVEDTDKGIQVYADPIDENSTTKHFMIDAWGNLRAEEGRSATTQSPLLKPLASTSGWIPQSHSKNIPPQE